MKFLASEVRLTLPHQLSALALKLGTNTCDIVAGLAMANGLFGLVQGIAGAVAAVLSAIYFYYRLKKLRSK